MYVTSLDGCIEIRVSLNVYTTEIGLFLKITIELVLLLSRSNFIKEIDVAVQTKAYVLRDCLIRQSLQYGVHISNNKNNIIF
jgi:hypothetical protein